MGGQLNEIHPSAQQKDMLIEGSKWFDVDHQHLGYFLEDVKKNYSDWRKKGKTQAKKLRQKFSYSKMKELIGEILDKNVDVPKKVKLKLPQIKKIELPQKPKLEKVDG